MDTENQLREKIRLETGLSFSDEVWGTIKLIIPIVKKELADDQRLPPNRMACSMRVIGEPTITEQVQTEIRREMEIYSEAQQDMLKQGWRKVKQEGIDGD